MATFDQQFHSYSDINRMDRNNEEDDLKTAIENSLREFRQSEEETPRRPARKGLLATANALISGQEENVLELGSCSSSSHHIEALSFDEQLILAKTASIKETQKQQENVPTEDDDDDEDLAKALQLSLDPKEHLNSECFMSKSEESKNDHIWSLEELEAELELRNGGKKKQNKKKKIAAKFAESDSSSKEEQEDMEKAIRNSLQEVGTSSYALKAASQAKFVVVEVKKTKKKWLPVVVDGCNVGFQYGKNDRFCAKGLLIVYEYFSKMGYSDKEIIIIYKHVPNLPQEDRDLIDRLEKIGVLVKTPSRIAGNQRISSDDDLLVLQTATQIGGVVMSKDQYRDSYARYPDYKDVIKNRLLPFNFIGDNLVLPKDPLGKNGPPLEEFLCPKTY